MPDQHAEARAAIRPVKEAVEAALLDKNNVVGVDIAEKEVGGKKTGELSIVVFVDSKKPLSKVAKKDQVPEEIEGVKTDVQEITVELQASSALRRVETDFSPFVDGAQYTTLEGGISMGPLRSVHLDPPDVPASGSYIFVGTLGALVRDRASGATMALTNFHVACVNNTWTVGDRMVQQALNDGGNAAGQFGSLTRATLSDAVDGAVVTLDAGRAWNASVHAVGDVAGTQAATVGMTVQKRGRTTEHTFGRIVSTDFTVTINYGSDVGSHTFHHQIRIEPDTARNPRFSDHGDSGSVILTDDRHVVGLLYGGTNDGSMTFANPIASVLDELSVDLLTAPVLTLTKPLVACGVTTKLTTICGLKSKIVICEPIKSKFVICEDIVSKYTICLTKGSPICDDIVVPSKPPCGFPVPSKACDDGPPIDWGRIGGRGGFGGGYGSAEGVDEAYLAGYLKALEEIDAVESASDGEG
jgi:hypothetical protein